MLKHTLKTLFVTALFGFSGLSQAAPIIAEQVLLNNGGDAVAINGEWAFVGDKDLCKVHIYKYDYLTNKWGDGDSPAFVGIEHTTLNDAGCTNETAGFGTSVSTSNGLLVIGAPQAADNQQAWGKMFLYQYNSVTDAWEEQPIFIDPPTSFRQVGSQFGASVSVRHDGVDNALVVVGSPLYTHGSNALAGRAYLYDWNMATNNIVYINSVAGEAAGDQFGTAVTSNGVNFLVGAPLHDAGASNSGAAYLYSFVNSPGGTITEEQKIDTNTAGINAVADHNLGISVSLSPGSDSVMLLGGDGGTDSNGGAFQLKLQTGTYVYETHLNGTFGGDVSQDGDTAGFGYKNSFVALDYDHQNINPAFPQWVYPKNEADYGRDISVSSNKVMVNGNTNDQAYAYYTPCGQGGSLKANEWTMIGLQCATSATINEIFATDLGIYDTNWVMYKQNGTDYEGHQNAYVKLASTDVLLQGQGYWIIADVDKKWQIHTPATATGTLVEADPLAVNPAREDVAAVHSIALKSMLAGLTTPTADIKVMFSNPFPSAIDWSETLIRGDSGSQSINNWNFLFEALEPNAYAYKSGVGTQNGYLAIPANTPGMPREINPGEGFFVRFSSTFYTGILQNSGVAVADFLFSQSK